jgi:hypothetical protein
MAPPSSPTRTSPGLATLAPAALAVLVRPWLWPSALHQLRVLAAPGWWRRAPHLPLPPDGYWRFRMVTAYGDPDAAPVPADLVTYLGWCRQERRRRPGRWAGRGSAPAGGSVPR